MKTLRPTILPAVPRFLNRIHKECVATANKTSLFRQVQTDKLLYQHQQLSRYLTWASNSRQTSYTRVL